MNPIIEEITKDQIEEGRDHFKVGDGVKVSVRVREGGKERIQVFSGIVICRKGRGSGERDHAGPHVLFARPRGQESHQGQGVVPV